MNNGIDWTKFVATGGQTDTPWVIAGVKYATNGRVGIAVPTDEPETAHATEQKFRDMAVVIAPPGTELAASRRWPSDGFEQRTAECVECGGCRYVDRLTCDACKGFGDITCHHCGHTHDCEKCDGEGMVGGKLCLICRGAREPLLHDVWQVVDGRRINTKYVRLILSLGAVKYVPDGAGADKILRFTFGTNGVGAVMPLAPEV